VHWDGPRLENFLRDTGLQFKSHSASKEHEAHSGPVTRLLYISTKDKGRPAPSPIRRAARRLHRQQANSKRQVRGAAAARDAGTRQPQRGGAAAVILRPGRCQGRPASNQAPSCTPQTRKAGPGCGHAAWARNGRRQLLTRRRQGVCRLGCRHGRM
jgi:hypothetical protein